MNEKHEAIKVWLVACLLLGICVLASLAIGCTPDEAVYTTVQSGNVSVSGEVSLEDNTEVITVSHDWHSLESGYVYFLKGWQDVDGDGTAVDFLWSVPETTSGHVFARWDIAGEGEFTLELYEGVAVSNEGTPQTEQASYRDSGASSEVQAFLTPVLLSGSLGDGSDGGLLIWSGKVGSMRTAVIGADNVLWLLAKPDTYYWFRVTHNSAGTHWLDYNFYWHEHGLTTQ